MRRLACVLLLVSGGASADTVLKSGGATVGPVIALDCRGSLSCTRSGATGRLTPPTATCASSKWVSSLDAGYPQCTQPSLADVSGMGAPVDGGIVYGAGAGYAVSVAGASGQCLVSGGAGAPTWAACYSAATGSVRVDIAAMAIDDCYDFTVTLTGASLAQGATCNGVGYALSGVGGSIGLQCVAWPNDTSSAMVRCCCNGHQADAGTTCDPADQNYYVRCEP